MATNKSRTSHATRHTLKDKKILITAGATWVPIDNVRVISNTSTGETGILLSEKLKNLGAKVTLLLGPAECCCLDKSPHQLSKTNSRLMSNWCGGKKIKLIRFRFFDELKNLIEKELKSKKHDIVIHSAAVCDYKPEKSYNYKVGSDLGSLQLKLVPTIKIIDLLKRISPQSLVVGFKFEPGEAKATIINEAGALMQRANLDLVVANSIEKNKYLAYILNHKQIYGPLSSKKEMSDKLINLLLLQFNNWSL